ncbi:MAG TPA: PIG-L family deacetylase [Acidimicrobiales bacterium]|nr:PIG-L family deacetylase [Acidimicrobiales bacterium]
MGNSSALTLMAVHAHPDDESSSTGGVLALYSREGARTVLVTCTNGEYGDGAGHVKPGQDGHDPDEVAKTRLTELERAVDELGVTDVELLGYHDSGMPNWTFREEEHVFWNTPIDEPVGRLVALMEQYRPDVVVTYDNNGSYNHPDHLRAHEIAVAATEQTGIPAKLYFTARRRRGWEELRVRAAAAGIELPIPAQAREPSPETIERMNAIEARITTEIDVSSVVDRKRSALAAHASQLDESWWLKFPAELFSEVFGVETFIRHFDRTGAPVPEDDLFAGLR